MVNHRVDASHGEFPGEDRGIRGNSPDPTGTESHSERARQLHWKKIYADHPMLTVGVASVNPLFIAPSMQPPDLQNRSEPVRRVHYELALRAAEETGRIFRSSAIERQRHYRGRERIVQTVS